MMKSMICRNRRDIKVTFTVKSIRFPSNLWDLKSLFTVISRRYEISVYCEIKHLKTMFTVVSRRYEISVYCEIKEI